MKLDEKIQTDIAVAMKDREEHRLTTLQMMKLALRVKVIEKREKLTDAEVTQILTTLIKQRGVGGGVYEGRQTGAGGEGAAGDRNICGAIAHLQRDAGGVRPGPRDLGTAMQVAQQWIRTAGLPADRKLVRDCEGGTGEVVAGGT